MEKHKIYSSLSLLCFNSFLASLVLVVCSYFSILSLDVLVSSDIIFGVGMFLGFVSLVLWEKSKGNWEFHLDHKDKKKIKEVPQADDNLFFKVVPHLFLLMLLIIAANQFFKWAFVNAQTIRITILAITFGAITFWRNRDRVEKEIEQEKEYEEQADLRRENEFDQKFPRLSKLNLEYGFIYAGKIKSLFRRFLVYLILAIFAPFIFLIRLPYKFVKWMYKEGFGYSWVVILLVIIGFVIRLYHLGDLGLWWDELITGTYVTRILETGLPLYPSGAGYYTRGVAYHYFVSIFTFLFGNTEFFLRLPSVLFGMGIAIVSFMLTKKINKKVALIVLVFIVFSTYNIEYSRFARFYIANAFLFILSIYFFWNGFFKDKLKYKFLSIFIFFIMMNTVQLGMLFMSLWALWSAFLFFKIVRLKEQIVSVIKEEGVNFYFFIISFLILVFNNSFIDYLSKKINNYLLINYSNMSFVESPVTWSYIQFPKWTLLKFFNDNYFPLIFLFFGILITVYSCYNLIKKNKLTFLPYLGGIFLISVFMYEFGSRDVTGARIYLFAEAFIIIFSILGVYFLMKIFNRKLAGAITFTIFLILFLNIAPNFYGRINLNYGESVSQDPFRNTDVAAYRADYNTQYEYLGKNFQAGDIWINVMGNNYFSYNSTPNYILNQNINWNANSYIVNDSFIYPESGSIIINRVSDIDTIVYKNKDRRVWLVVNGGSINILYTTHVRSDFIKFLEQNQYREVYRSPDGIGRVLLFNAK